MGYFAKYEKTVCMIALCAVLLLLGTGAGIAQQSSKGGAMEPIRITPTEAYKQVRAGSALLVCAYLDEGVCKDIMLEGAISLAAFEKKLPGLKKDQGIIFYCA
jgi:hypothetical protein